MTSQRGGFVLGMIVGLLLGLVLALGVALYIAKVPIPFVNKVPQRTADQDAAEAVKNRNWDPNAGLAGKSSARAAAQAASGVVAAASVAAVTAAASAPAPSGKASAADGATAPRPSRDPAAILSAPATAPTAQSPAAAASRSTGTAADPFTYFVQAGAYSRADDAEQQRARLGLLGIAAKVMEREQAGRTVYRVRVGPFEGREEAEATISRLQGSGVDSALVRVER